MGAPVTFTASLNSTPIETILPVSYVPPESGEVTLRTAGAFGAWILILLDAESEPSSPGSGSVVLATLLPMPLLVMFPPTRIRAFLPS